MLGSSSGVASAHSGPAPMATGGVLDIGLQIAEALSAAQKRHLVQRDLKSANIVLLPDGQVKVLDFGQGLAPAAAEMAFLRAYAVEAAKPAAEEIPQILEWSAAATRLDPGNGTGWSARAAERLRRAGLREARGSSPCFGAAPAFAATDWLAEP